MPPCNSFSRVLNSDTLFGGLGLSGVQNLRMRSGVGGFVDRRTHICVGATQTHTTRCLCIGQHCGGSAPNKDYKTCPSYGP